MGVSIGTGSTTVTGSVTTSIANAGLPKPTATQTLVQARLSAANDATTLYTATAGKTFYCLGCVFSSAVAASQYLLLDGTAWGVSNTTINGNNSMSGGVLFSLAATKAAVLKTNGGAGSGYCAIWGYEE